MSAGIRSAVLADFEPLAIRCGLDPRRLLAECRLPANSLTERDLMLPVDQVNLLLEASARLSGNASFGLDLAQHRRLSHLGELGLLLRDLPTVRHVLDALSEYVRFHNETLVYALETEGDSAHILMDPRTSGEAPPRQFSEFVLGSAFRIFQQQFADDWNTLRVCFRHDAPAGTARHLKFFGHLPQFGYAFNGFICPTYVLDRPNPAADPAFSGYARNLVAARVAQSTESRTDEIRRVIFQLLPRGRCDAENIAATLGIDRRTVSRQLQREATSVSVLIDEARTELAVRYVRGSTMPLTEVATLLGFKSASALSNWYRRQFGVPPSSHR